MKGKGKQFVPAGRRVKLAFPGGAGYGDPAERDPEMVRRDLARGYISAHQAHLVYGLAQADIEQVEQAVARGEEV
jgi:N-methylhydantoinase B